MDKSQFERELKEKMGRAENAIQAFSNASQGSDEEFGKACDEYACVAKDLAALVTEERIRRSFEGKINDKGKSNESLEQKLQHARQIRRWLAPWNLALRDEANDRSVQIYARKNSASGSSIYQINPLSDSKDRKRTSKWAIVREVLCSPKLIDVSQLVHSRYDLHGR